MEYYLQSIVPKTISLLLITVLSTFLMYSNIINQPTSYANAEIVDIATSFAFTKTPLGTEEKITQYYKPPKITSTSSTNALQLAKTLKSLDSKMYGAYWCSHCYDQKQTLGKEVFRNGYVAYIECDKEGYENQRSLCKERKVPGYPTWEIGGKLFPGEQSLEELATIADEMKSALNVK